MSGKERRAAAFHACIFFMGAGMDKLLYVFLALMSLVLFIVMGADKRRAKSGARRVPEKTLFLLALFGGAVGGTLGMRAFRHKTKHWYFAWGFPLLALAQLALAVFVYVRSVGA